MQTTTSCTADAAVLPASITGIPQPMPPRVSGGAAVAPAEAPEWRMTCIAWLPTPDRSAQLGLADLALLPHGLTLFGARFVRLQSGHIHVLAPRHKSRPTFRIADDAAWLRFSAAALEAVQAAFPAAIPITARKGALTE